MANCCYEFIFFLIAMGILVFLKIKKVSFFGLGVNSDSNDSNDVIMLSNKQQILQQKDKVLAALFETIGQATYLFALSEGGGIAAVIMGAGTVITSLILSRVFLKEKLSMMQYVCVAIVLAGIILLSFI